VSDRGEYADNATTGHVSGYDVFHPDSGSPAEWAWGGIDVPAGQGILTRAYISGGWTWTGHDYRGEPSPYNWPDVNSHFGIVDLAGFEKDRFYWYQSWFIPSTTNLYLFPHWNWSPGDNVTVWAYSNADEVELFVNGASLGVQPMQTYAHVAWNATWEEGSIRAVAYKAGSPVAEQWRNTTGAPAALVISVKDGVGSTLVAGCADVAYIQVAVVDSNGAVVPTASDLVTFAVSGPGSLVGTANGDPSCLVNNLSSSRPAFHGLVLGVVVTGDEAGLIKVQASAPGLTPVVLTLSVEPQTPGFQAFWCHNNPRL